MARREKPPQHIKIAEAHREIWDAPLQSIPPNLKKLCFYAATAEEAAGKCWACGHIGKPNCAHIVRDSLGGENEPDNYWLLCDRCHGLQPDRCSKEVQLVWLKTAETERERTDRLHNAMLDEAEKRGGEHLFKEFFTKQMAEIKENMSEEDTLKFLQGLLDHFTKKWGEDYVLGLTHKSFAPNVDWLLLELFLAWLDDRDSA